ncbi:phosphatidylethanolamine-binding protein [Lophiotrema nucula]|uniref:Phosphatidylethanolamine-binding protein n=1 Tax=Lophiotrema nucula TaxID=690887 RepID=A0A6A5YTX2_9PLEO|nr:phosphatidylethanolamine-binding protein [Lophiotrema nucula]
MPAPPATIKQLLETLKNDSNAPVRIHYPAKTVTTPGTKLSKQDSKPAPTLSISSTFAKSPDAKYLAFAIDLDAPFPSMPVLGPILHGIQTDLTTEGEADADGYVKLATAVKPVVIYAPPGPPPISAPHRYVFLIWEQPQDLTSEKIRTQLGLAEQVGIPARMRWNQDAAEKKLGLGAVLGGNYFVV